jgi:protein-tyrosine kinase
MSKIHDALQISVGEQLANAKAEPKAEFNNESVDDPSIGFPSASSLSSTHNAFAVPKIHTESELMVMAQNLSALLPDPDKNVIQFIGSRKGEGTSTLVREFALFSAQHSQKPVLLVEADLIQPSQYHAFGMETTLLLDQVSTEGNPINSVISRVKHSNLFLATLTSTINLATTVRLFSNPNDIWQTVREQFSLILIDSSPVNVTADSLVLCNTVDGIVLVVEAEKTRSAVFKKVRNQILRHGNLLGITFTKRKMYISDRFYKLL